MFLCHYTLLISLILREIVKEILVCTATAFKSYLPNALILKLIIIFKNF